MVPALFFGFSASESERGFGGSLFSVISESRRWQPSSVRCALFIKSRSRLLTGAVLEVINRSKEKEVSKAPLYINHHRNVEGLSLDALFVVVALSKPRLD